METSGFIANLQPMVNLPVAASTICACEIPSTSLAAGHTGSVPDIIVKMKTKRSQPQRRSEVWTDMLELIKTIIDEEPRQVNENFRQSSDRLNGKEKLALLYFCWKENGPI